jgi:hypothetical protein
LGFANNRCLLSTQGQSAVTVVAHAIMASTNYIQGQAKLAAFDVSLPDNRLLTMLGNITSGSIKINHAALALPWAPLNVLAS